MSADVFVYGGAVVAVAALFAERAGCPFHFAMSIAGIVSVIAGVFLRWGAL